MNTLANILYLVSILFSISINNIKAEDPRVTTAAGEVIGQMVSFVDCDEIQVKEFLGIPFAKPPLGELRFQKPQPLEPWSEPLECKTMPKACSQYETAPYPWAMNPNETEQNVGEDCLYMNIWVPNDASSENKKAIFFWIHGGKLFTGSIRQELYDGHVLAGLGDVIVVTTNYRLGSLGFWSSDQETAPGNIALLDMIAALTWVHTYIEAFGGDNTKITLAGQGTGSIAAGILALGNTHSHMIRRLIMQSGAPAYLFGDDDTLTPERSIQVATRFECANKSYTIEDHPQEVEACMRRVDALSIMEDGQYRSFLPRYTAPPLEKNPLQYLSEGDFHRVELLIGTNLNEGAYQVTIINKDLFGFFGEKDPEIHRDQAEDILKKLFGSFSFSADLVQHYLPAEETDFRGAIVNAVGDFTFVCPTVYFAEKFSHRRSNKVYFYNFNHRPSHTVWADWMETTHFEEVQFVFGQPFMKPDGYTRQEKALSRMMMEHWTNFTKEGKPFPPSIRKAWPLFSEETPKFLWYNITERGIEQSEGVGPHKEHCDFFRKHWDWLDRGVDYPKVTTELGEVIGQMVSFDSSKKIEVKEFLGVPFAKPPLGELRFQKPVPIEPWSKPLKCQTMPKACVQKRTAPYPWAMDPSETKYNVDEDCLYMNIWVPIDASPDNRKAVFLWIYGGGFFSGSIRQTDYDGRVIAGLGDVIVVTTNYRLGGFGFWSSDQETAPGNVGLLDMIAALTWVYNHIESFGGDNTQITLAGESGGAVAVGLLVLGHKHSKMIRRVIMQSSSPANTLYDVDTTPQRSLQLATRCGCANETYTIVDHPTEVEACMRRIDSLKLIEEEGNINPGSLRSFRPRYGVDPLEQNPRVSLQKGDFNHVELLAGIVLNDGAFRITTDNTDLFGFFGEKDPEITKEQAENLLKQTFGKYDFYKEVVKHYLPKGTTNFKEAIISAAGDFTLICNIVYYAEKFAEHGSNVYFFNFNHRPSLPVWAKWMGPVHYDEVQFVFGQPFLNPDSYTSEERELSKLMIEHWTTFTKEGSPYSELYYTSWPNYSRKNPKFMWYNITEDGAVQSEGIGPHKEHCDFFRDHWDWFPDVPKSERVTTELGELIGHTVNFHDGSDIKLKEFLGVPFAKPPLGELRFGKPQPLEPWGGQLECKSMPKACVQYVTSPFPWAMNPNETEQNVDEDCLYMNIWVPNDTSPENKKAVFFWIYGGGFLMGSISQELYDGRAIAGLGDVIVVTTNYRLGSLGFWSSDRESAPGNVGLLDMIAALTWVYNFIEDFGGDKTRITVAGESAGSIAAGILILGNGHSKMIRRLIMQSGSPAYLLQDNDATPERSLQVAIRCGCAPDMSAIAEDPEFVEECMRGVNALTITKEEGQINPGSSRSFLPRNTVPPLAKNPRKYLIEGQFNQVDLMAGTNSHEGSFQVATTNKDLFGFFGEKDPKISREQAVDFFKKLFGNYPFYEDVVKHYLPDGETDFRAAMVSASGDFIILCPTVYFSERFAERGNKVYYYNFNHRPSHTVWADWMGTAHFEEVQFVFGQPLLNPDRYTPKEKELSRMMIAHWTNFTKNGYPFLFDTQKFESYSVYEESDIDWYNNKLRGLEEPEAQGPHKEHCDFFRKYWDWLQDSEYEIAATTQVAYEHVVTSQVANEQVVTTQAYAHDELRAL